MPEFIGKTLIILGLGIVALGIVVSLLGKWPGEGTGLGWLGKLPGDIFIKRDNFTFYFPLRDQYPHQRGGQSPSLLPPEAVISPDFSPRSVARASSRSCTVSGSAPASGGW